MELIINKFKHNYQIAIKNDYYFKGYPISPIYRILNIPLNEYKIKAKQFNGRVQTYHFKKSDTIRLAVFKTKEDADIMLSWVESIHIMNKIVGD